MKDYKSFLFLIIIVVFMSCDEDSDKNKETITTGDLKTEITYEAVIGDVIGTVPGSSTSGSVSFAIESQLPNGMFTIAEKSGELKLADEFDKLSGVSKALLKVSVSANGISEIARVEIKVVREEVPEEVDLGGDPSPWVGDLMVIGEWDTVYATGTLLDSITLELAGPDPLGLWCNDDYSIAIEFKALLPESSSGSILVSNYDFPCYYDPGKETFEASGSYDTITKVIEFNYKLDDGDWLSEVSKTIKPVE